ncbi:hypothetical protein [Microvirga arabica]|uniref:hypothetical protein n=1 Tax=Microvirga arabica TaxID=1128671 RepID=UPI00193A7C5B|nr:hypothetical protein [Microvirga arabica]MBM1172036.1 hypothetical protein [Microvirga arabica]
MRSPKQIAASRVNAQRSTGPRSAAGRARSRLNALKHGLSKPASAHPELQREINQLAGVLAGEAQHDPVVLVRAVRVAEAAIDVQRARRARVELMRHVDIAAGRARPDLWALPPSSALVREALKHHGQDDYIKAVVRLAEIAEQHMKRSPPPEENKIRDLVNETAWTNLLQQLERLDRYERRARSRRDRAIRDLERMRAKSLRV